MARSCVTSWRHAWAWSSKMASSVMEELYAFRPYDREAVDALAAEMLAEVRAYEAQKEA